MEKIFITGINGLLGTNLTFDLLEKGYSVKGLIRNKSKFEGKNHPNLELIEGNLFDDLTQILKEIDTVIHIAAETSQNIINYYDYWKINCNATNQLLNSAILCKVKKFVFVSSVNTLGYGTLNNLGTEKDEIKSPLKSSFYALSKLEAENILLKDKDKIKVIIINPSFMIGAYDTKPSSGKIILMGLKKKIIFYPPGGKNFVDVKDVSRGIISSLNKGKNGEKYIIANENISYVGFFEKLNKLENQFPIMIRVPKAILIAIGYLGDGLRFFQLKTNLSSTNMRILCIDNFYNNQKSISDLEMEYLPIEAAIKDSIEYFKKKFK
ncbi:NAD-dependent epimerase/dehydratase family protein [Flavobacterium soyangense]|uniref:NAD-dependent epimerase/dehydratase family protein n=1 Tax=Flavobacterium soyangense TaxID=2023265 RepID=A0A930XTY3_9FLAO|nr:NAD-dependent epimerase/dehydratase family protein [Flavobacterium soyangense]MBF2707985.1 NAD-dependent epimerase/dehydratase family protein [Flavobacterium soyangense]